MRSIMSLSSCSTMWQWCTYLCGLTSLPAPLSAVLGNENLARTTVTYRDTALQMLKSTSDLIAIICC